MTPVKTLNNVPEVVWNFAHPEMGTKLRQQSVAFFAFVTVWSLLQFSAGPLSAEAAIMLNGSIIFAFLLGVMIWREPATHLFIINKGCFIEAVVVDRPICTKGLCVRYRYEIGSQVFVRETPVCEFQWHKVNIGDRVIVAVNPEDFQQSVLYELEYFKKCVCVGAY